MGGTNEIEAKKSEKLGESLLTNLNNQLPMPRLQSPLCIKLCARQIVIGIGEIHVQRSDGIDGFITGIE